MTKEWILLWSEKTEEDHTKLLKTLPKRKITSAHKKEPCIITKCNGAQHMLVRYLACTAPECGEECKVRFRINICAKHKKWMCYQMENTKHPHSIFNEEGEHSNVSNKSMASDTKQAIRDLLFKSDITRPYRIHRHLKRLFEKGEISMHPTLKQVQNFIHYERKKAGIQIF